MKRLVIDIDGTLTIDSAASYEEKTCNEVVAEQLREYHRNGFEIILYTARNMRSHNNNTGKIIAKTLPILTAWLEKHNIPYDEIHVGKPWCGHEGFYVDDKAVRPSEFVAHSHDEIMTLLQHERDLFNDGHSYAT